MLLVYYVIRSELWDHAKKKKSDKTCCNQNILALPLPDDLWWWSTITFSSNCSMQHIRIFLSANEPTLHRLVSQRCNSLLTFLVIQSPWKWAYLELPKVKCFKLLNRKKGPLFFYINSGKLETKLAPTLDLTKLYYTSITQEFNIPVVMSWPWILLAVVVQLAVMAIFSWSTPVLLY